ncbi:MAG: invasion associated locus B family protein [Pseudomonadota bacterium]
MTIGNVASALWRVGGGVAVLAAASMAFGGAANAQAKQQQSAWVKLCEDAQLRAKGADGKVKNEKKEICLTHHERLDGNTGTVIVSAAIREVKGSERKSLMVMVPLGMALPPGLRAAVYTPDQWKKAQANKKIDEKKLKPLSLKFSLCHPAGCTAETEATDQLVESMKTGGGLMILAVNAANQPVGFPVPLTGFTAAHKGKAVDNKLYAQQRGKLMAQIRARQKKIIAAARKKREEAQKKKN